MPRARHVGADDSDNATESDPEDAPQERSESTPPTVVYRVQTRQSPHFDVFCDHHTVRITVDTGATGNMIRHATARRLGAHIVPSTQAVRQADGSSPLKVMGETRLVFTRGDRELQFEGLVVANLDVEVLAGMPFMESHRIIIDAARREVSLGGHATFKWGNASPSSVNAAARREGTWSCDYQATPRLMLSTPSSPAVTLPMLKVSKQLACGRPLQSCQASQAPCVYRTCQHPPTV